MDFPLAAGAYRYRPLIQRLKGWDIFALQTALNGIPGAQINADGFFGKQTAGRVETFQRDRGLATDQIAGIATQQKLCQVIARQFRKGWQLPNGIPYGTLEHESSCWLGNHTAPYPDGERDCGVTQRNTNYSTITDAFDVPDSLFVLCERIRTKHDEYRGMGVTERRAWELACGSWNAPAWTDTLARGGTLLPDQKAKIEAYIAAVTIYAVWD